MHDPIITAFLTILQSRIKFVKLDGSMSMAARDQMIEAFTKDADTKVNF